MLRAPFDGEVVEVADPLDRSEWVERGEPLAMLVDRTTTHVEAFVAEQYVHRLAVGRMAQVRPRNPDLGVFAAVIEAIDTSAMRQVPDVSLASTHGGPIPARVGPNNSAVPETPVYRVRLRPVLPIEVTRMELATVRIEAEAESLLFRSWRHIKGVLIRESGF
jgi:putative peptide zinc metalloprotease protein